MHRDARSDRGARAIVRGDDDRPGQLVPEHHRFAQDRRSCCAVAPVVQIRAADAAVRDLDDGFIRRGGRFGKALDPEIVGAVGHDGGNGHEESLSMSCGFTGVRRILISSE